MIVFPLFLLFHCIFVFPLFILFHSISLYVLDVKVTSGFTMDVLFL